LLKGFVERDKVKGFRVQCGDLEPESRKGIHCIALPQQKKIINLQKIITTSQVVSLVN